MNRSFEGTTNPKRYLVWSEDIFTWKWVFISFGIGFTLHQLQRRYRPGIKRRAWRKSKLLNYGGQVTQVCLSFSQTSYPQGEPSGLKSLILDNIRVTFQQQEHLYHLKDMQAPQAIQTTLYLSAPKYSLHEITDGHQWCSWPCEVKHLQLLLQTNLARSTLVWVGQVRDWPYLEIPPWDLVPPWALPSGREAKTDMASPFNGEGQARVYRKEWEIKRFKVTMRVCYCFKHSIWQSALPTSSVHRKLSCHNISKISFLKNYFLLANMLWTCNASEIVLPTRKAFKVKKST